MKFFLIPLSLLMATVICHSAEELVVIPKPASIEIGEGKVVLTGKLGFECPQSYQPALEFGLARLTAHVGVSLSGEETPVIVVREDKTLPSREAYGLKVGDERIEIRAKDEAGVFYACQTLLQLIREEVFDSGAKLKSVTLPEVAIEDTPRFHWRGLMLDSSRHFQTVAEVKRFIDLMSLHKLNVFHWHLTDSHGWRFESKRFPKLTEVGAWRMQPGYPKEGERGRYGGFYTQEEMKEVVDYAIKRQITIVPEIDMPGHCFSMVAAYPEMGCLEKPQEVSHFFTYPADAQRFPNVPGTDVLCVGKDRTIKVCKDILDELMDLFPSKFIHIGGDEVNKSHWKSCKHCQARKADEGLKDEHELQSWFIRELDAHFTRRGRRLIGWDEILEGGLAKNATVMSWQGEQGGLKAAGMGHDVVMSPQTYIYLDHGQSHSAQEPAHWPGHKPLDRVYGYEPIPAGLAEDKEKHVLGVQGNVWTVFVHEEWLLDLVTWPRAAAIAEVGWTPKQDRDWERFRHGLATTHRKRLDQLGVNYWWEESAKIGDWSTSDLAADNKQVVLEWKVEPAVLKGAEADRFEVSFHFEKGAHGLSIKGVELWADGRKVSSDVHDGFAGSVHRGHVYSLEVPEVKDGVQYTIKAQVFSDGGTDSKGRVMHEAVETKRLE